MVPAAQQTIWMTFLAKYLVEGTTDWSQKFKINVQRLGAALGTTTSDFGGIQIATIFSILNTSSSAALTNVPITNVTANGGKLADNFVDGADKRAVVSHQVGTKQIVNWNELIQGANVFTGNAAATRCSGSRRLTRRHCRRRERRARLRVSRSAQARPASLLPTSA